MPAQVSNSEVVSALRESRNKLNHGGRHWIKGALKRWVSKDHSPGARVFSPTRKTETQSEAAFCAVGAINDTVEGPVRIAAKVALAEVTIIRFNDGPKTTWPEVRTAFTKAARRLSQRKG